jgi:cell division protein FtsB
MIPHNWEMKSDNIPTLTVRPLNMAQLRRADKHNARMVVVPNADIADSANNVRLFGDNRPVSVVLKERIEQLEAVCSGRGRHVACEAVYAVPPDAERTPSMKEFGRRVLDHARTEFGERCLLSADLHMDEKTPHIHVLVVPLARAWPPGCKQAKQVGEPPLRVTWNVFSGSDGRRPEEQPDGTIRYRNPTMARWQTTWAACWEDHGYRRGAPSSRRQILPKRLHGTTAKYAELAQQAEEAIKKSIEGFSWAGVLLSRKPVGTALWEVVAEVLREHLEVLVELAARGIQLPNERSARIETAGQLEAAKGRLQAADVRHGQQTAEVAELRATNATLAAHNAALARGRADDNVRMKLLEDEVARMQDLVTPQTARPRPPLPSPVPRQGPAMEQGGAPNDGR